MIEKLKNAFSPHSIIVVGVSNREENLGKYIIENLKKLNYRGKIYPVGKSEGEIKGLKIYTSFKEIPDRIPLATVLIPSHTVPQIVEELGKKQVGVIHISSGGFGEFSEEGKKIENELIRISKKYGFRLIGPNCLGIVSTKSGVCTSFIPIKNLIKGKVSIISQSGGIGLSILQLLKEENIGVNKFLSIGNKIDLDEVDYLEFLINDKETSIIYIYLESIKRGSDFVKIAMMSKKPVIVQKANKYKESAKIAFSHTEAMVGDIEVFHSAMKKAGVIVAENTEDGILSVKSFLMPPLNGCNLCILSRSGGHAVISADQCTESGFNLPQIPSSILNELEKKFKGHVIKPINPVDLGDLFSLETYFWLIEEIFKLNEIDGISFLFTIGQLKNFKFQSKKLLLHIKKLIKKYKKPLYFISLHWPEDTQYLKKQKIIPIFSTTESAIRGMKKSLIWRNLQKNKAKVKTQEFKFFKNKNLKEKVASILSQNQNGILFHHEGANLLKLFGLNILEGIKVQNPQQAVEFAKMENIFPCVIKVISSQLIHKSEENGIILNIKDEKSLYNSGKTLIERFKKFNYLLLQPQVRDGLELILGAKRDREFGAVVTVGMGGKFVEIFKDYSISLAPINEYRAEEMIKELKIYPILKGFRGEKEKDIKTLINSIVILSRLIFEVQSIIELDINPFILYENGNGGVGVDVRIILKKEEL